MQNACNLPGHVIYQLFQQLVGRDNNDYNLFDIMPKLLVFENNQIISVSVTQID